MSDPSTRIVPTRRGALGEVAEDVVLVEGPLQIQLNGEPLAVTMRTPGQDDALAHGLAIGEGLIAPGARVTYEHHPCSKLADADRLHLRVAAEDCLEPPRARAQIASASCGLCGVQSINDVAMPPKVSVDEIGIDTSAVPGWFHAMEQHQRDFKQTGGSHAAALFDKNGQLLQCAEDVGRHNAVDKVIGLAARQGHLHMAISLVVSGRVSFEIVSKAARAGIPYLAAVSAPSTLAISTAEHCGMCLLGFCRGDRFTVYSHPERLSPSEVIDHV